MKGRKGSRKRWVVVGAIGAVIAVVIVTAAMPRQRDVRFIVGKYRVPAPTPTPIPAPPTPALPTGPVFTPSPTNGPAATIAHRAAPVPAPVPAQVIRRPVTFSVPKDLKFFLVIGTDARPGQDMLHARADSIHIAAVDPKSREGTILGIPRDSWVDIPGHGRRKINAATVYGGPNLLVKTLRDLTRLPISYYAVTGFAGISKIVDELEGVRIYVPYRMDDHYSGARFERGWHHMDGREVLAFSRARHGVPKGDFGRSENHGRVMLHTLTKLRAETKDRDDVERWMKILYKYARLDLGLKDAMGLAMLARQMLPAELRNVVTPGSTQTINGQSVVVLGEKAKKLWADVAADAVADGDLQRQPPKPTPAPKKTPKKTPKPTPTPDPIETLLPDL